MTSATCKRCHAAPVVAVHLCRACGMKEAQAERNRRAKAERQQQAQDRREPVGHAQTRGAPTMTWITAPSTAPEAWRKRGRRIARQALYELWPTSPPIELTHEQMVYRAQQHCVSKGWPPPSPRTIQRAINGT